MKLDVIAAGVALMGFAVGVMHMLAFWVLVFKRFERGETEPIGWKTFREMQPPWMRNLWLGGPALIAIAAVIALVDSLWRK